MTHHSIIQVGRAFATLALILALFDLAAAYVIYREPRLTFSLGRLASLLAMLVVTVWLAKWADADPWRAESVPMLFFGQTLATGYRRAMALMTAGIAAVVLALAIGQGEQDVRAIDTVARLRTQLRLLWAPADANFVATLLT